MLSEAADLVRDLFDAFGDHLQTQVVTADIHSASADCETAYNLVQGQRLALQSSTMAHLQAATSGAAKRPLPDPDDNATTPLADQQLDLVGVHDFEDRLAIERATRIADVRYAVSVESLKLRVAELEHCDPSAISLPVFAREICAALRTVCLQHNIPRPVLPLLCDFFIEWGEPALEGIYTRLNLILSQQGIRPDVEQELSAHGSVLAPLGLRKSGPAPQHREKSPVKDIGERTIAGHGAQQRSSQQPARTANAVALYAAVMSAPDNSSASRIDTGPTTVQRGDTNPGSTVDTETLAQLLHQLQQDRSVREELACEATLSRCVGGYLHRINGNEPRPGISSEHRNKIALVDQLFTNLRDALDVQPQLKPVLGALQLPLAKLAILEPGFFVEYEHPARKLIDRLSQLSIAANFPNRSLTQRLQEIVAAIVTDYHTDSGPFREALREADKLLSQQRRALTR